MHVRHPIWLKRLGTPGAESFAILFAFESFSRALLASVIPLEALQLLGSARAWQTLWRSVYLSASVSVATLVIGVLFAWLIADETLGWAEFFGGLLVVAGVFFVVTAPARPSTAD